jgi:hypothetical protein
MPKVPKSTGSKDAFKAMKSKAGAGLKKAGSAIKGVATNPITWGIAGAAVALAGTAVALKALDKAWNRE